MHWDLGRQTVGTLEGENMGNAAEAGLRLAEEERDVAGGAGEQGSRGAGGSRDGDQ